MSKIVIGLDPGVQSSATGFAAFDPITKEVLHVEAITSNKATAALRIREISKRVAELLEGIDPELEALVAIECFVMRGKGGETLARMTGALMAAVPEQMDQAFVFNTTVKKEVGGHGKADKDEVAAGVAQWLSNKEVLSLSPDITDALAIGICGWLKKQEEAKQLAPVRGQRSTSRAPRRKQ